MGDKPELDQAGSASAPSGDALAEFWARVREHKIIQWGLGYLGAALALAHGQELVAHALQWPDVLGRILVIVLIVGFPIALTLAWYHGHRGLTRVSAGELMITSVLVLIGAAFFTVALPPDAEHAAAANVREGSGANDDGTALDRRARAAAAPPAAVVTRFLVTPPATAPLASQAAYDLAISPDGTRLVYVARNLQSGGFALYSREFDSLEVRALPGTEVDAGGNVSPFFSADGTWIGFGSPGRGIMRVAVAGGPPLKIVDYPEQFGGATWGADGTLIFSSIRSLHRVSAGGGGIPEQLTATTEPAGQVAPRLLPGGRAVLFGINDSGEQRIAVLDLQSREQKNLIEDGSDAVYVPTGHVVFVRDGTLVAVPFDLERLAVTGEPAVLLQGVRDGATTAADLDFSAMGTLVYVPADRAPRELVWVNRGGRVVSRAVDELIDDPRSLRLSPDDEHVALVSGAGNNGGLWIHNFDGRPPLRLTEDQSAIAAWSPDGRDVVFGWSRQGNGTLQIYRLPADGSSREPRLVGPDEWNVRPAAWSAGGKLLVQRITGADHDIVEIPVETSGAADDVAASDDLEYQAALSPNGRWLAYISDRSGEPEVWVQPYPKGVAQRITRGGQAREPVWSRDGKELLYLRGNTMMAVDVETDGELSFGPSLQLFSGTYLIYAGTNIRSYDVARDGRFLMLQPAAITGDAAGLSSIVVVQNWFAELERRMPAE